MGLENKTCFPFSGSKCFFLFSFKYSVNQFEDLIYIFFLLNEDFFGTTLQTKGYENYQHKPATAATWLPERTKRPIHLSIFGINKDFNEK